MENLLGCFWTKAFDCVWHKDLLLKLDAIGIRGKINKLLTLYLCDRKQLVVKNGQKAMVENLMPESHRVASLGLCLLDLHKLYI